MRGQDLPKKLGASLLILVMSSTSVFAMPMEPQEFAGLKPVADEELADMRGGFRFSNGVNLDFALKIQSAVGGEVVRELNLHGNSFHDTDPEDFRTVIQVGKHNDADIPRTTKINVDENGNTTTTLSGGGKGNSNYSDAKGGSQPSFSGNGGGNSSGGGGGSGGSHYVPSGMSFVPEVNVPKMEMSSLQSALKGVDANNLPGILTVIQNTLDNTTIQHFNILDVNVSNLAQYKLQAITSQIGNPALGGIH